MAADYYRYICENSTGDRFNISKEQAIMHYTWAVQISQDLPVYNPIRLGTALNFSVFTVEILENKEEAVKLASAALDSLDGKLEEIPADEHKEAFSVISLIKDNISLWTEDSDDD